MRALAACLATGFAAVLAAAQPGAGGVTPTRLLIGVEGTTRSFSSDEDSATR